MTGWRQPIGSAVPSLTLGDAVELLRIEPFACACSGGPWCCAYVFPQAKRLHRGAHILVKMIADLAQKGT